MTMLYLTFLMFGRLCFLLLVMLCIHGGLAMGLGCETHKNMHAQKHTHTQFNLETSPSLVSQPASQVESVHELK